jgi:hypothetical protein
MNTKAGAISSGCAARFIAVPVPNSATCSACLSVEICFDRAVEVRLGQLLDPLGGLLEGRIVDQDV